MQNEKAGRVDDMETELCLIDSRAPGPKKEEATHLPIRTYWGPESYAEEDVINLLMRRIWMYIHLVHRHQVLAR